MDTQWRKDKVTIRLKRDDSDQICEVRPYISTRFTKYPESGDWSDVSRADFSFSTLGIILIELCFGKPFEEYKLRKEYQCTDPEVEAVLDHAVALQWCNAILGETGPEYDDAVKWCLDNTYKRTEEWRSQYFYNVIEPIRDCYDRLTGHSKFR